MPQTFHCFAAALLSLGMLSSERLVLAADDGHASATAKPTAKAAKAAHTKASEPNVIEAPAPSKPEREAVIHAPAGTKAASEDPMVKLQERLAEKLGAVKSRDAAPRGEIQIVNRSPVDAGHGSPSGVQGKSQRRATAQRQTAPSGVAHAVHWGYQGSGGPKSWGQLKPAFAKCASGTRQSPIDIRGGIKVQLEPVLFDYTPRGFSVIDNGHTVQVNVAAGNFIEVIGRRYELVQFHFHRPSEERVNGRQFDMVVHFVHKDLDGRLAVVAVLLDRGNAQPQVQTVWNNLPLEQGEELPAKGELDLNAMLPADRSYFTYMGSLTTPPCSEGVLWMVMKTPVSVSAEQMAIFARLYPMNARPIQQASGRLIKESN